jgi:N-formylglutamate deformylase
VSSASRPGAARVGGDHLPHRLPGERAAPGREEERLRGRGPRVNGAELEVGVKGHERRLAERHEAALFTLAQRKDEALLPIDVGDLEATELAHPQARRVHHVEHRPVAQAAEAVALRRLEEPPDLVKGEHLGEPPADLGPLDQLARVGREGPLPHEEAGEASHRGEMAGRRAGADPVLAQRDQERRAERRVKPVGGGHALRLGVRGELAQIAGVRLDAAGREGSLDAEVVKVGVHPGEQVHTRKLQRHPPERQDPVEGCPVEPFEVFEPRTGESPLVVEVPHAGIFLDPEALSFVIAPARSIGRDADLYVDRLFQDAPAEGASLLIARTSRYVVDLNRSEDDVDSAAVLGGGRSASPRGLIWRLTTEGDPILGQQLPQAELTRRLDLIYRPYHRALTALLERKLARFGFAILLCAHSMPSHPRSSHPDGGAYRADLVPGTRGRTSAAGVVIDRVDALGRARKWTIRHDDPYRGGFSTGHYGKPAQGVHAVQIEIARRRYMEEATLRIDPHGFAAVREFARSLAARLAFAEPDAPLGLLRREAAS